MVIVCSTFLMVDLRKANGPDGEVAGFQGDAIRQYSSGSGFAVTYERVIELHVTGLGGWATTIWHLDRLLDATVAWSLRQVIVDVCSPGGLVFLGVVGTIGSVIVGAAAAAASPSLRRMQVFAKICIHPSASAAEA